MVRIPVIAILDAGKTNKKLLLFDENYKVRFENSSDIPEIMDEDGFPCEDISAITVWARASIDEALLLPAFNVKAINFSAHGASFVYLDDRGKVVAPLYNYLKPYPSELSKKFYEARGGEGSFSLRTASPVLGSLNSGLQLYRLKHEQPRLFDKIKYALHLPQYLCFLFAGKAFSDITSIGCHTGLWDFTLNDYHHWVFAEGIHQKLAPLTSCEKVFPFHTIVTGIGLHDSSAALIPYLKQFREPFILLSTGTWNITLNPFNSSPLTQDELNKDCLCYLDYQGKAVKASRLFAGHQLEVLVKKITQHFHQKAGYHTTITYDKTLYRKLKNKYSQSIESFEPNRLLGDNFFRTDLSDFNSFEEAYHQLMREIINLQFGSTSLVLQPTVKNIYVDGGFSKNSLFMNLLKEVFPSHRVYAASVSQASSLGAAMAIHNHWNNHDFPENFVALKQI